MSANAFPECENYERLRDELGKLPKTWYPDLIRALVIAAYEKRVFVAGGASNFVRNIEAHPNIVERAVAPTQKEEA